MSFLKKLFDKVKNDDDKYGKGHKLGSAEAAQEEERRKREYAQAQAAIVAANRQATSSTFRPTSSNAAHAAGQAALARLQQQQQPKLTAVQKQILREQSVEDNALKEEKRRLDEAQRLKEHYFGDSHRKEIEASTHLKGQKIEILFKCPNLFGESVSLPKATMEMQIEDKLMENLNSEPVLTALTLLFTANYKYEEKLEKCLDILKKLIDNIVNNPQEEKYRKIRCENVQIREKLLSCKYAELLLETIGFKLVKVRKQGGDENADDSMECVYLFQHGEEKNYEKLQEFQQSLDFVQPIKPVLDRNIQLYYISSTEASSQQQLDANKFNLSDDFYNLNIDELKREQKMREDALEKSGMLRTKAMRERDEVLELRKYNYCLIRVKLLNDFYLQMLFKSNEQLKELYLCVQSCLRNEGLEFDLGGPLLKQQQQNLNQTFAELGLAPATVLHFRLINSQISKINELFKDDLLQYIRQKFT